MRRRLLSVLALAVVAAGAVVVGQDAGEEGFLEERRTECWGCHVAWTPPLQSLYNIIPPDHNVTVADEPVVYPVRIQNPWLHEITYFEASIDLTGAPSLAFASTREPIIGQESPGSLDFDRGNATQPRRDEQIVEVLPGATSLTLTATPDDTGGLAPAPSLRLMIHPRGNATGAAPARTVEGGPGDSVVFHASSADLFDLGYGNWTIVVEALTPAEGGSPASPTESQGYTLVVDQSFEVTGEKRQYLVVRSTVGPEQNILFRWAFRQVDEVGPDEHLLITLNATVYYAHENSANPDFGNVTKSLEVKVVPGPADEAVILAPSDHIVVPPQVRIGVSMARVSEAVGYVSAFLLIASIWSGGMFGRASRRHLNVVFGSAKRRVVFHNALSYALTLAALVHLVLFLIETFYHWTLGMIWGSVALLAMLLLGVTGALQVPMIRRWNYATWRWSHNGLSWAAIVFTIVHLLLDGQNFVMVQEAVGWNNPFDPRVGA